MIRKFQYGYLLLKGSRVGNIYSKSSKNFTLIIANPGNQVFEPSNKLVAVSQLTDWNEE